MPKPPLPPELDAFLAKPNAAVIATVRPDGSPVTVATWYDWEDGRILVNMDEGRRRVEHLRADPRVSMTVMDVANWGAHVSLQGRVVSLERRRGPARTSTAWPCATSAGSTRSARTAAITAWIEIDRYHAWHPENL